MSLPPSEIPQGAIRFNTDSQKLEFYAQGEWWVMSTDTPNLGRSVDSTPGARGLWGGGNPTPTDRETIEYVNIASTGNAVDFGNLSQARNTPSKGVGSRTRGIFGGGSLAPVRVTTIDAITFASTGNGTDIGDLSAARAELAAVSNETRGVFLGGAAPAGDSNEIDYITIASGGTAQDWGTNLPDARERPGGAVNSPTRGLVLGGTGSSTVNTIDFITIHTTGTHGDFGDLNATLQNNSGGGNSVRGIINSSGTPSVSSQLSYVTIATLGNSANFGDLSLARAITANVSSPTRVVFGGGITSTSPAVVYNDTIDYNLIATQGTGVDFGNLSSVRSQFGSCSNAHGGL